MPDPVENAEVGQQYWLTWWLTTGKTPHVLFQCWKVAVLHIDMVHPDDERMGRPCVCAPIDPDGRTQGNSVDCWTKDLYATREDALNAIKDKFEKAWQNLMDQNDALKSLGDGGHVNMAAEYL